MLFRSVISICNEKRGVQAGSVAPCDWLRFQCVARVRQHEGLERIADHEAPAGELAGEAVAHAESWQGDAEYLPHRADA